MANYATSSLKLSDTYVNTLPYNTCSTAAGTAAKTVSAGDFSLETGAMVVVKFTVTNTAANPTLNVSSTGAKAIYYNGAAITAGYLKANKVYQFIYNGTQWDLVGDVDTDTNTNYYHTPSYTSTPSATTTGGSNSNIKVATGTGVNDLYIPTATGSTPGVTIVYPMASCTTFTSDTGSCTPAAVRKAVGMFDPKTHTHDYIPTSQKGAASGVAELDANGKVPAAQLPSYVDDVLEYSAASSFPATGETGKIYVDTTTNKTYRWGGSAYVEISASLAIGTTSSTAAAGNHTHGAAANKGVDTSISAASTSTNLPTSKAVAAFVEGKGYKTTDNNTTYTIASGDSNGQIKVTPSSGSAYNVSVKGLGSAAYTASTAYAAASHGTHVTTATVKSALGTGSGTTKYLREDGTWQVPPDSNTTYGVVSTTANGLAPKRDGSTTKFLRADGTWAVPPDNNTTYSVVSTSSNGLAPKLAGGTTKYLRADGTWATPPDTNTTYSTVSTSASGLAPKLSGSTTQFLRGDGSWATPAVTVTAVWG